MTIVEATRAYEAWLGQQIPIIRADLAAKHERMAEDAFSFFRATFYRWMQLLPELCAEAFKAPAVLSVGDLHVENYGTWRDAEGRLIWGINDFDEAAPLPYTNDLIRLATSASLAIEQENLILPLAKACAVILEGYTTGLETGGGPFVLSEQHRWLRDIATSRLRDPTLYWEKLTTLSTIKRVPPKVLTLLRNALPNKDVPFRVAHRQAGLGSLGRERYTALADWCGGKIAREAKPLVPSACVWSGLRPHDKHIYYADILRRSVRAADPFLDLQDSWILRRLSPYCSRIELAALPRSREEEKLLWGMGRELANIHLGQRPAVPRILQDLRRRKSKWLRQSTEIMTTATLRDWKAWRKRSGVT
ncbi:MAG: DUF2252 family protein [Chthoniobacter sp.]|uniref:DUF2252 family protein n=1 Tax=Chthoniobacter sp. TaxID=2510640 RepID=UPI0032A9CCF9